MVIFDLQLRKVSIDPGILKSQSPNKKNASSRLEAFTIIFLLCALFNQIDRCRGNVNVGVVKHNVQT